jgi:hypothetical protein
MERGKLVTHLPDGAALPSAYASASARAMSKYSDERRLGKQVRIHRTEQPSELPGVQPSIHGVSEEAGVPTADVCRYSCSVRVL